MSGSGYDADLVRRAMEISGADQETPPTTFGAKGSRRQLEDVRRAMEISGVVDEPDAEPVVPPAVEALRPLPPVKLLELKIAACAKLGLPARLHTRLAGSTAAEILEDAVSLSTALGYNTARPGDTGAGVGGKSDRDHDGGPLDLARAAAPRLRR